MISRSVVAQGATFCLAVVGTLLAGTLGSGQGLDPAALQKRAVDSWPTYHGDYSGQRHSPLTQITPANVSQMTLAWAFQTGQSASIKSTPIVINGMLYVSAPDQLWAIDARTARQVWQYRYPDNTGFHIGHRGVAVYKDSVFLTTPDAHLVALDARNGKVKWNVEIADAKKGYWSTNAPLLIRNHLLVGVAGDFDNLPGILTSVDPDTGKTQWVYYSTPPPGTPGSTSGGVTGGQMWMTGTYDPELDLVYVGTGNPTPVLNGDARPGDNTWTNSVVALHPETGRMEWGFQTTPHDTHDWDAAEVPVLVDGVFDGAQRKMILQAARNGYFFVLDRANGTNLKTIPFAAANWATGVDKAGRPIPNRDKEPSRDGRLVAPNEAGGTNYRSPSFDPDTGLFIVSAHDSYGIYFFKTEHGNYGWAGADYNVYGRGVLRAIDYRTGAVRWSHELGDGAAPAGVLTTASGLVFTGDNSGNALALRTSDGATMWHASIGTVGNAPITYELDGRQYVVMGGGGVLFGFTLPAGAPQPAPPAALNPDRLTGKNVSIAQTTFKGRSAIQLTAAPDAPNASSYAVVKDAVFRDGTIELELAGQPAAFAAGTAARGFIGVAFRLQDDGSYEYIYLRPTNGRADDQVRRNHSTQYSAHPTFDFARSRQEAPEKYESYVDLEPGVWTKYKIEIEGRNARLYVHGAEQPCLIVNDMKLEPREGGVALWVGPGTEGYFSNLKITAR